MINKFLKLSFLFCSGFIMGGYPLYKYNKKNNFIFTSISDNNCNHYKNNQLEPRFNR